MVAVLSDRTPVDLADPRVNLRVAVRAEHHALAELLESLLPRSGDSVAGDPVLLCARVEMMEVEGGRCVGTAAAPTRAAKERDRADLDLSAQLDDAGDIHCCLACVAKSMTICAHEVALRGFREESCQRAIELAESEIPSGRIPMVELQRFDRDGVAAIDTASAACLDELTLPAAAAFVERSEIRVEAATALRQRPRFRVRTANRIL